jgi:hypothetical protein
MRRVRVPRLGPSGPGAVYFGDHLAAEEQNDGGDVQREQDHDRGGHRPVQHIHH